MPPVRATPAPFHRPSDRAPDRSKAENPIAHHLRPAGSFLGDFHTPTGARNSSRKRTFVAGSFGPSLTRSGPSPGKLVGSLLLRLNKGRPPEFSPEAGTGA